MVLQELSGSLQGVPGVPLDFRSVLRVLKSSWFVSGVLQGFQKVVGAFQKISVDHMVFQAVSLGSERLREHYMDILQVPRGVQGCLINPIEIHPEPS